MIAFDRVVMIAVGALACALIPAVAAAESKYSPEAAGTFVYNHLGHRQVEERSGADTLLVAQTSGASTATGFAGLPGQWFPCAACH
jgi:hypothetical protein